MTHYHIFIHADGTTYVVNIDTLRGVIEALDTYRYRGSYPCTWKRCTTQH